MKRLPIIALLLTIIAVAPAAADVTFTTNPVTDANVDEQYEYSVGYDTDGANTTLSIEQGPEDMTLINDTVTWTPTEPGTEDVNLFLVNDDNSSDNASQDYTVEIEGTPGEFNGNDMRLGGEDQDRDETITQTYTVENTGTEAINNFDVSFDNVDDEYEITADHPATIQGNSEVDVDVSIYIPEDQNAGEEDIGTVDLEGTSVGEDLSATQDVILEAKNNLEIDDVEVFVDGRRNTFDDSPAQVDREIEIDSEVELVMNIENVGEVDLEDIEWEIFSSDLISADGRTDRINRLRDDRREELEVSFQIDSDDFFDIRDEEFLVETELLSEDENGATHNNEFDIEFEMDRENEDVRILNTELFPSGTVQCNQNSLRAELELANVGFRDLEDIYIRGEIPELDLSDDQRDIELFEGEQGDFALNFNLPEDRDQGSYFLELEARPERTEDSTDTQTVAVDFADCTEDTIEEDEDNGDSEENDGSDDAQDTGDTVVRTPNQPGGMTPVDQDTGSAPLGLSEDAYVFLLLGLIGLLLIVLIALLIVSRR